MRSMRDFQHHESPSVRCDLCSQWSRITQKSWSEEAGGFVGHEGQDGECRVDSPRILPGGETRWPVTYQDDFCGKFVRKGQGGSGGIG